MNIALYLIKISVTELSMGKKFCLKTKESTKFYCLRNSNWPYVDPFYELDNVGTVSFVAEGSQSLYTVPMSLAAINLPLIKELIPPSAQYFKPGVVTIIIPSTTPSTVLKFTTFLRSGIFVSNSDGCRDVISVLEAMGVSFGRIRCEIIQDGGNER